MGTFTVMVDDNFHFMDEDERYEYGSFDTADAAIAACKAMVDRSLADLHRAGMTPAMLVEQYQSFGDDPFVLAPANAGKVEFSAWDYARERAAVICRNAEEESK